MFKRELEGHLRRWRGSLVKVQTPKQMWFPERVVEESIGPAKQRFVLQEPICLAALPLGNPNSRKERRVWAFIDGFFEVENGTILRKFGASAVFFEAKPRARRFRLLDAYHFDFHVQADQRSSPHALFHSQRNVRWELARWQSALNEGPFETYRTFKFPEFHHGIKSSLFKLSRIRIPTPRLDIFGLILATTADMLIQHDVEEHRAVFDHLISLVEGQYNPLLKLNIAEPVVADCAPHGRSSVGGWYPLYSRLPPRWPDDQAQAP